LQNVERRQDSRRDALQSRGPTLRCSDEAIVGALMSRCVAIAPQHDGMLARAANAAINDLPRYLLIAYKS
ncbi:MAG: hypothetical protein J2P17_31015, partial [Mycobacterium sp.]|nr:hypothetical protein [Mycobacterium sp.]